MVLSPPGSPFGDRIYFGTLRGSVGTVYAVDGSGQVEPFAELPSGPPSAFAFALGPAFGTDLFVGDSVAQTIWRVRPWGEVATFATDVDVWGICFDAVSGAMYVAEDDRGQVLRVRLSGAVDVEDSPNVGGTSLGPTWPGPARAVFAHTVSLLEPAWIHLAVYDIAGRQVARLVDGDMSAGRHELRWAIPPRVPGGVYWLALRVDDRREQQKLVVLP